MMTNPVEQITTRGIATIRGVQSHLDAAINLVRSRTDAAAPVSLLSLRPTTKLRGALKSR